MCEKMKITAPNMFYLGINKFTDIQKINLSVKFFNITY